MYVSVPTEGTELYSALLAKILPAPADVVTAPAENSTILGSLKALQELSSTTFLGNEVAVVFAANAAQVKSHVTALFPEGNVHVVSVKPTPEQEDAFYGAGYPDALEGELNFVLSMLTELERSALTKAKLAKAYVLS